MSSIPLDLSRANCRGLQGGQLGECEHHGGARHEDMELHAKVASLVILVKVHIIRWSPEEGGEGRHWDVFNLQAT